MIDLKIRHKSMKHICFLIVVLIALLSGHNASSAKNADDLVIALSSDLVTFDPTNYRDRTTQNVIKALCDSLTARDDDLKVIPHLAESWVSINDTTWEFRLRRGVLFHNGDPFTARDVKFTFDRVINEGALEGKTSPRKTLFSRLMRIELVDDYTVRFVTDRPWPILPVMLSLQEIMPRDYVHRVGIAGFIKHPVGTGPYSFLEYRRGDFLALAPNDAYFGDKPVHPHTFRRLVFLIETVKVDQIVKLKRRECDLITSVPPGSVEVLRQTPGIRILQSKPTRSYFAEFNVQRYPYNDIRVRRAFNLAMDIKVVIDHILYGQGRSLPCLLLPDTFGFHPDLKVWAYEPETARKLLKVAAFPTETVIRIGSEENDLAFAYLIAAYLTRLGLKTAITKIPRIEPAPHVQELTWDILVTSWGNTTFDPIDLLNPIVMCDGVGNHFRYCNTEIDQLLMKAEETLDVQTRLAAYHTVQEIIQRDIPFIFGYAAVEFYAINERIEHFTPNASGIMKLSGLSIGSGE
ncbi:hypothetical protein JXQ70_08880 [bacterium]|nr:hypothetical protein [bacterium]